ncbi:hypothetical protein VP01_2085g1 [Puccinia sorghi]|uniref:Reverse transcriptase Ty1/copia-type domain-containing protein n=1 Tax=Puccinia sorghi TaxID=27349 RepID=A0A0L6VAG3_9BASI|nr:hypothetical protein VP01_2085g1 [Puccinia sorghi]
MNLVKKKKNIKLHQRHQELKKKSWLCIHGISQILGIDYDINTFAPKGKFTSLLIVMIAFCFAPLKENLSIKTPKGSKRKSPFIKLKKSLYGLKKTQENWFETTHFMVFIHKDKNSVIFFHIDNSIVIGKFDQFKKPFVVFFSNFICA